MTDPLLEAVDALAKPVVTHFAQKSDAGKWLKAHTITRPPLLQQMAEAVMPSGANKANGAPTAPNTRSLIDLEALFEFRKMVAAIGSWCRIEDVMPERNPANPVKDLERWYVARLARRDLDDRFYITQLAGWVRIIRNKLDPPESFTAEIPCPICQTTTWGDMINGGGMWPIEVKYRLDEDTGHMTEETALCRPCKAVWVGHASVMELADEAHEKRAAN